MVRSGQPAMRARRRADISLIALAAILGLWLTPGISHAQPQEAVPSVRPAPSAPGPARPTPGTTEDLTALMDEELRLAGQLIEQLPETEEPLVMMGNVHARRGNTDQALEFWKKAVQMNPKRADVYDKMARLTVQIDEHAQAIALWRSALQANPTMKGIREEIARAFMKLGDYEACIRELREAIQASEDAPETHFLLGQACQHLQDYEKAKAQYEQVIQQEPDHVSACYNLYRVCTRLKLPEEARQYLARFKALKAEEKETLRTAGETVMSDLEICYDSLARFCFETYRLRLQTGNNPEVQAAFKRVFGLGWNSVTFLKRLAVLYSSVNRIPEALALYQRIAQLDPQDATCQLNIGILSIPLGRLAQAEQAFRGAIALAPDNYAGYQELARLYLRIKSHLPEAQRLARRAVALEPTPDTYYDLGLTCYVNGDLDGALEAMQQAIEIDPTTPKYTNAYQIFRKKKDSQ